MTDGHCKSHRHEVSYGMALHVFIGDHSSRIDHVVGCLGVGRGSSSTVISIR